MGFVILCLADLDLRLVRSLLVAFFSRWNTIDRYGTEDRWPLCHGLATLNICIIGFFSLSFVPVAGMGPRGFPEFWPCLKPVLGPSDISSVSLSSSIRSVIVESRTAAMVFIRSPPVVSVVVPV